MARKNLPWVLTIVLALGIGGPASAWNNTGHKVIALLAYQALDKETKQKVQDILKDHPHYDEFLAKDIPDQASDAEKKAEWIAMKAATWPDWVRSGPRERRRFHRGTWHYVNKPYIVEEDEETRAEIEAQFSDPKRNNGEILAIIPKCQEIIKAPADTKKEKEERAVRLCWLLHLIGDLHQPLHAVALCNKRLPGGDHGGNLLWVRRKGDGIPQKLHAIWDNLLGHFESFDGVTGLARNIQKDAKIGDDEKKVQDPNAWADESVALAKSTVYNFNGKLIDFVIETDSHGPSDAPRLPEGYETEAKKVAAQRSALAGHRLAAVLAVILAAPKEPDPGQLKKDTSALGPLLRLPAATQPAISF